MAARKRATRATKASATDDPRFAKGDRVAWNTSQGETEGVVERRLVARTRIEGHEVAASRSEPQYLVRSATSGKTAAHKPSALRKLD